MTDKIQRLEEQIADLNRRLRRLEKKVLSAEEPNALSAPAEDARAERARTVASVSAQTVPATVLFAFMGRSLIVLGGAFFLRWLTQSGTVSQAVGIILGIVYALVWLILAGIMAGRDQRNSAVFHGATSAFIVFPLLVEATTTFHYLSPLASAASVLAYVTFGLVVAARRKLESLAWIVTLPIVPLVFFLSVRTAVITPFLFSLLAVGFMTLWLGYLRRWQSLATLMAGAANLGLAIMVLHRYIRFSKHKSYQSDLWEALCLLFGLIVLYFGSYCFRVFRRKRTITALEIGQTLVTVLIGLGGATLVIYFEQQSMFPLGIGCLILSAACYTAAYGFLPRRDPNRRNFLFFTLLALAMGMLGCELSFQTSTTPVVLSAIALFAGILAHPIRSPILFIHGSLYLIMAIVHSQLFVTVGDAFIGSPVLMQGWASVTVLSVFVTTVLYPWFRRPVGRKRDMYLGRRAADCFFFVAVLALGGVLASLIAQLLAPHLDANAFQRVLASVRTGILAGMAVMLARYHYRTRFENLAWLVYAILVLAAAKLLLADVTAGGAATLFFSFGFYGGALILAPRLLSKAEKRRTSVVQSEPTG